MLTLAPRFLFIIQAFVGRVVSLLFNILSRFVIAFLPRSKRLLISWLQSPSTVILEPKKRKTVIVSIFSPSISHEVMGTDAMIIVFLYLVMILTKTVQSHPLNAQFTVRSELL